MDSCCEYEWRISQVESSTIPESMQISGNVFFIQVQVKDYVVTKYLQNDRTKDKGVKELLRAVRETDLVIKKDLLLSKEDRTLASLTIILCGTGVPARALSSAIDAIAGLGKKMVDSNPIKMFCRWSLNSYPALRRSLMKIDVSKGNISCRSIPTS